MPTYVSLIHWTEQGISHFQGNEPGAEFSFFVESGGGRVRELLWTIGEYDIVAIVDFPDDETGAACLLRIGSHGKVRTNTLRAFSAEEMGAIIGRAEHG
jgi:uncharacterized protein with GYD domain